MAQTVLFEVTISKDAATKSSSLYLAGDFNGWHTADTAFQLKKMPGGKYSASIKLQAGDYNFKVVRGNWESVEVSKTGQSRDNRHFSVKEERSQPEEQQVVKVRIANWADNFKQTPPKSTAARNVTLLDSAFNIPQLGRKRRIWVYVPKDYHSSGKRYPVLYLQDGQNVFDAATSFSGEWGVDDYLNRLATHKQCLVVAIANGGNERMQEYNPYNNQKFGKGEGKAYAAFMAITLKPYIDQHYRTKKSARYTSIAGSSMGGLISFYTAICYPEVFGNAGIFSPSFWIAPQIYSYAKKQMSALGHSSIFFYGGGQESKTLTREIEKMQNILQLQPGLHQKRSFMETGAHNEQAWQREFPAFYGWLLKEMNTARK